MGGYNSTDKSKVDNYLSGLYAGEDFDVTRYYAYRGESKLSLEVGLLKDYENYNLTCDKSINNTFSCTLELVGEDNKTFYASKEDTISDSVLNH